MKDNETSRLFTMNLKRIRCEKNLTQDELARLIGCSRKTIGSYERGETFPSPDQIDAIANAMDIEIASLFLEKGAVLNGKYALAEKMFEQTMFEAEQDFKRRIRGIRKES